MNNEQLEALERAIHAGGEGLKAEAISGLKGKKGEPLLQGMIEAGWLSSTGKGTKLTYSVTPAGKAAYAQETTPERKQARAEAAKRNRLLHVLRVVGNKTGKKIVATDKVDNESLEAAKRDRLIAPLQNGYELLDAGKLLLDAEKPISEQVAALKWLQDSVHNKMAALQEKLTRLLPDASGPGGLELQSAKQQYDQRINSAMQQFETALSELSAFSTLIEIGRKMQEEVEKARAEAHRQMLGQVEKLQEPFLQREKQLHDEARRLRDELKAGTEKVEEIARHIDQRIANIEKRLSESASVKTAQTHVPHTDAPKGPSDAELWDVTRREYERLRAETAHLGGYVKIPDITDAIRQHFPALTPTEVHQLLLSWEKQGKFVLQTCDDPSLEPRAAQGMRHESRGLLFYIQMF